MKPRRRTYVDLTKSKVDAAGRRIRRAVRERRPPDSADVAVVSAFRAMHIDSVVALSQSLHNLREILLREFQVAPANAAAWEVAARPKTVEAILARLSRSSTSLSSMQDITGARLVVPTLEVQDFVLEAIRDVMTQRGHNPRVKDTRETGDELGYRAIHIIIDWVPKTAEIQLRTTAQAAWAQLVERLDPTPGNGSQAWWRPC